MFKLGENRASVSKSLDGTRIEEAMQSLKKLFGENEYASIQEMRAMLQNMGFEMVKVFPARVPTGCNEFVSRKTS